MNVFVLTRSPTHPRDVVVGVYLTQQRAEHEKQLRTEAKDRFEYTITEQPVR